MANLMPQDIVEEVRSVLAGCNRGKGTDTCFLTAYQVLNRLPASIRDLLMAERGGVGAGAGVNYGPASVVADAAELLSKRGCVEIRYMDSGGVHFDVSTRSVEPGYGVCGIYRLTG